MTSPLTSGRPAPAFAPVLAAVGGICAFSAMDAAMKGASLMVGVYTALLLRNGLGAAMILPVWLAGPRAVPPAAVLRLHALRATVNTAMAFLFFVGIVRLPIAEGIALSFIAPLVALGLAALFLGETIRPRAMWASLLGLAGVAVIVTGRYGQGPAHAEALTGVAAVLVSALLYAVNLILQRKQALVSGPVEVALSQNTIMGAILALFAPWCFTLPDAPAWAAIALSAALATLALVLLSWAYGRAEAQVLLPVEYTAFLWAALFGWLIFAEPLGPATLAGAALIVLGCWLGTRESTEQVAL